MPCYQPLEAYWKPGGGITFSHRESNGNPLPLPCGRCIGCRLDHAQMWTARMLHELHFHDRACFITLTYADDNLPPSQSLSKDELQKFFKRFRKHLKVRKIRYYACGEYGGQTLRPHYHAIIYGWEPDDLRPISRNSPRGTSATLERIWGLGYVTVGPVNYETCAYTARYVTKKITGPKAEEHYLRVHRDTGEIVSVLPEFATMSRRPGLGSQYFDKYGHQLNHDDFIVVRGNKAKVPRYYDKLMEKNRPDLLASKKETRVKRARENRAESTPARLAARHEVALHKSRQKKRVN